MWHCRHYVTNAPIATLIRLQFTLGGNKYTCIKKHCITTKQTMSVQINWNKSLYLLKIFLASRWFLDIEKSVRLKLKGVKIIRIYRDLFQLIIYLFQLIYSSFSDWELMRFCIVVHRHLPASVKYKRSIAAIGALVTLCLLCHSSF